MHVITCVSSCAVDVTVYHDVYHGDLNETVFVGKVDEAGASGLRVLDEEDRHRQAVWGGTVGWCCR